MRDLRFVRPRSQKTDFVLIYFDLEFNYLLRMRQRMHTYVWTAEWIKMNQFLLRLWESASSSMEGSFLHGSSNSVA